MRKINLIVIASLSLTLTACNISTDINTNNTEKQLYIPSKFNVDTNTLRESEVKEFIYNDFNENFDNSVTEWNGNISIGEINILEEDNSANYIIDGENIVYEDVTFNGLADVVNKVSYPCSTNTFINFIIKTYDTKNIKDVYTYLLDYQSESDIEADAVDITLDEDLSTNKKYIELKTKYGTKANWQLDVFEYGGKNKVSICGCKDYIFVLNSISDIKINTNDIIEVESTDEVIEETIENIDETLEQIEPTDEVIEETIENIEVITPDIGETDGEDID